MSNKVGARRRTAPVGSPPPSRQAAAREVSRDHVPLPIAMPGTTAALATRVAELPRSVADDAGARPAPAEDVAGGAAVQCAGASAWVPPLALRSRPTRRPSAPPVAAEAREAAWVIFAMAALVAYVISTVRGSVAPAEGWAVPAFALLAGYQWAPQGHLSPALARLTRELLLPYLGWLVLLGLAVAVGETVAKGAGAGGGRLAEMGWGGLALTPPLSGLWPLGSLFIALAVVRCAMTWLRVDPIWLLPAALVPACGGPGVATVPWGLGVAGIMLGWVVMGRLARVARPRLDWFGGAMLAASGAAGYAVAGPIDVSAGRTGWPIVGPLAAGAMLSGTLVLLELCCGRVHHFWRRGVDGLATVGVRPLGTALAVSGVGAYGVAASTGEATRVAAALGVSAGCAILAELMPRTAWWARAVESGSSLVLRQLPAPLRGSRLRAFRATEFPANLGETSD